MVPSQLFHRKVSTGAALNAACASVAAIIGISGYLATCGLQSKLASANASMDERIAMLRNAAELGAAAQSLHSETTSARSQVETLQARLPKGPDETQFLQELSLLAANAHLELSEFRPGSVLDRGTYKEIDLRIRARAPYSNLCQFLAELSEVPRFFRVAQFTLTAPSEHGGDCDCDLQVYLAFGFNPSTSPTGDSIREHQPRFP